MYLYTKTSLHLLIGFSSHKIHHFISRNEFNLKSTEAVFTNYDTFMIYIYMIGIYVYDTYISTFGIGLIFATTDKLLLKKYTPR